MVGFHKKSNSHTGQRNFFLTLYGNINLNLITWLVTICQMMSIHALKQLILLYLAHNLTVSMLSGVDIHR